MPAKWFGCRERRIGTQRIRGPLTALRLRMRELAQTRIRYGYRKIRGVTDP
jgi:hypothetical protein